jgi:hypothetical protein
MIRNITLGLVLMTCLAVIAGCGGGSGGTDGPPVTLTGVSYKGQPGFSGGQVIIGVQVNQDSTVASVTARITNPDLTVVELPFDNLGNGSFRAVFNAPTNTSYDSKTYSIVVVARDTDKRSDVSDPYNVVVPGLVKPPDPPAAASL